MKQKLAAVILTVALCFSLAACGNSSQPQTASAQQSTDEEQNIRINAVAPGATITPAHLANKAGEQPGGAKMLEYSKHFVYFPGPECDPIDQANACLFLASDMGRHVKGQVIQVCNGAFL